MTADQTAGTVSITPKNWAQPISFNVVVQYYDRAMGFARTYYNHVLHFRLVPPANITLSTSSQSDCASGEYPFSLGGVNGDFVTYGIDINPIDNNLILGGYSVNISSYWGDGMDGFVMRLSETGYIEWYTHVHLL